LGSLAWVLAGGVGKTPPPLGEGSGAYVVPVVLGRVVLIEGEGTAGPGKLGDELVRPGTALVDGLFDGLVGVVVTNLAPVIAGVPVVSASL